jgi:hypothetical protein
MDSRIQTAHDGLVRQFEMETGCVRAMNDSYAALQGVKSLREQLKDRADKTGRGKLADAIAALDKEAAELEGAAREAFAGLPPAAKLPENLSTINQHFAALLNIADSFDGAPTAQAEAVYTELQAVLKALLLRWQNLQTKDVPALNQQARAHGLHPVDLTRPPSRAFEEGPADADDEP